MLKDTANRHFNSSMVQLKDGLAIILQAFLVNFNSSMVQLKDCFAGIQCYEYWISIPRWYN